jgi:hypothetical protein
MRKWLRDARLTLKAIILATAWFVIIRLDRDGLDGFKAYNEIVMARIRAELWGASRTGDD